MRHSGELACECCCGTVYMWSGCDYHMQLAHEGDFFVLSMGRKNPTFRAPVGIGDDAAFCAAVDKLSQYVRQNGWELVFHRISRPAMERLTRLYPDRFVVLEDRDNADYVYERDALANLSGKKYHGKRNHISAFERAFPDWRFEVITRSNIADCAAINEPWFAERLLIDKSAADELCAVKRGLEHYFELGFFGGILYVGDRPAAYSFGEYANDECFVTHIEKALSEFPGAYTVINNQMARALEGVKYINREEDMGLEGLRKAKLSYHPAMLYEKFTVKEK